MSVEMEIRIHGIDEFVRKMDNLESVYMKRHIRRQLQTLGEDVHRAAFLMCPVRTGRLRASIFHRLTNWTVLIGATVPYAQFVEFGTHHFRGRFFLTEAMNLHLPRLAQIIGEGVEYAIREAAWRG